MFAWLEGKKTYIVALIGAVINLVQVMGWFTFTPEQLLAINGVVLALLGMTLRAGISKAEVTPVSKVLAVALLTGMMLLAPHAARADQPYVTVDPLGHKSVLNEGGAVPSPDGTHFTFSPLDADIESMLQGTQGAEPEDPDKVLIGFAAYVFVARTTAVGMAITRPDAANPDILRIAPTFKQYIDVGPTDSWLKQVKFQPFSYSFATGSDAGFTGSGLSVDMRLTAGPEIPIGDKIALQLDLGVLATLSSLGQNVDTTVDPIFGGTFVYRLRPKPAG